MASFRYRLKFPYRMLRGACFDLLKSAGTTLKELREPPSVGQLGFTKLGYTIFTRHVLCVRTGWVEIISKVVHSLLPHGLCVFATYFDIDTRVAEIRQGLDGWGVGVW